MKGKYSPNPGSFHSCLSQPQPTTYPKLFPPALCWTLVPRELSLLVLSVHRTVPTFQPGWMPKMSLATPHPTCLHSQDRERPFLLPVFLPLQGRLQCFRDLACQLFSEPSLISSIASLWLILQPERPPMRTFPPYPEEVLRAPPDTQPASRYDQTPGPIARCGVCTRICLTSASFPTPFRNTWKITSTAS